MIFNKHIIIFDEVVLESLTDPAIPERAHQHQLMVLVHEEADDDAKRVIRQRE